MSKRSLNESRNNCTCCFGKLHFGHWKFSQNATLSPRRGRKWWAHYHWSWLPGCENSVVNRCQMPTTTSSLSWAKSCLQSCCQYIYLAVTSINTSYLYKSRYILSHCTQCAPKLSQSVHPAIAPTLDMENFTFTDECVMARVLLAAVLPTAPGRRFVANSTKHNSWRRWLSFAVSNSIEFHTEMYSRTRFQYLE